MTNMNDNVIALLQDQKSFEEAIVNKLTSLMGKISNSVIKLMIQVMILDSMKHATILQAIMDLNRGIMLSNTDKQMLKDKLEDHISEEGEMLQKIHALSETIKDTNIQTILQQISLEEERHHTGLKQLFSLLDKVEIITEDEWWDYMNQWANFST
jgi:RNase adaptor protein for sRNA GlmZ degradation